MIKWFTMGATVCAFIFSFYGIFAGFAYRTIFILAGLSIVLEIVSFLLYIQYKKNKKHIDTKIKNAIEYK